MSHACTLEITLDGAPAERVVLSAARTVIGRHPSCDIAIQDNNVSRQHAAVIVDGTQASVEDLASRNGTFLNGTAIRGRVPLAHGDKIGIAKHTLRFLRPAAADHGLTALIDDTEKMAGFLGVDADAEIVNEFDPASAVGNPQADPHAGRKLHALMEFSQLIGATVDIGTLLQRLADGLCAVFPGAERAFVLLVDPESKRLVLRAKSIRGLSEPGPVRLSRSLLERVVATRRAILSADAGSDSRFNVNESIIQSKIQSVLSLPVQREGGEVLGVLYVDSREIRAGFTAEDLEVLAALAGLVSRALGMARAHDEALAREKQFRDLKDAQAVQQTLLPREPPALPGYEIFHHYEAARQLGGDLFSYEPLSGGRVAAVLADVSGKGVSAALVMVALHGEVRVGLASEPDVASALTRINDGFCRSGWEGRFATALVCLLDPVRHRATIGNAGHHPLLVRSHDGTVRLVADALGDLPLGYVPGHTYSSCGIAIEPGDTLVFTTDGITEALDNEGGLYGLERLADVLTGPGDSAEAIGRRLLADVARHTAGQVQSDDMCLMCIRRLPAAGVADSAR
ncbi:MAG: FHA domain-containing protein [Planctomycetia bacterium]|nr:FHA domain-containing protein [Planctomycetia bacterium]